MLLPVLGGGWKRHHKPKHHPNHHAPDRFERHDQKLSHALQEYRQAPGRRYYDAQRDDRDRAAYYGNALRHSEGLNGAQLYARLHDLVSRTHREKLGYNPVKHLYPWVDLRPNLKLQSLYSGAHVEPHQAIHQDRTKIRQHEQQWVKAAMSVPNSAETIAAAIAANQSGAFNCEHVVPKSWFRNKAPMMGDLHHLFACDPQSNSKRGSVPFAEVNGATTLSEGGTVSEDQTRFEPAGGKGEVARATLYFLLRYPRAIGDEARQMHHADLPQLLQWNRDYPPTEYERHRNAEIARKQGNRNPFIDFPQLADRVDFRNGFA